DIPTGLDSDTGIVGKYAFKSDLTITMELPKLGMYITPGNLFCGDIKVSNIGIPPSIYSNIKFDNYAIDKNLAKYLLPKRNDSSHKGSFGKILLIGGSKSYPGAIMLSSKSAVKSGAGLVYSAFPESLSRTISSYIPDTIKIPLKETEEGSIDLSNFKKIIDISKDMDAVLIGPGISDNKVTLNFVEMIIGEIDKPIILDADGLRILCNNSISIKTDKLLITPHPGEAARILGINTNEINTRRLDFSRLLSDKFKCTVLLKGYKSIITNSNETYINLSGNSALARGGSGDILSGIITAFIGNGMDILNAAALGSYLHGLAGEIASENLSKYSISMDELIAIIPEAFKCICCN
ncbi:NAD(P)H-hydrate dehydratase, partial [candidate division TA06 bacterium]